MGGCNSIYDQLITQLVACRNGSDHGHPRLEKGCLLKMDFKKHAESVQRQECSSQQWGRLLGTPALHAMAPIARSPQTWPSVQNLQRIIQLMWHSLDKKK